MMKRKRGAECRNPSCSELPEGAREMVVSSPLFSGSDGEPGRATEGGAPPELCGEGLEGREAASGQSCSKAGWCFRKFGGHRCELHPPEGETKGGTDGHAPELSRGHWGGAGAEQWCWCGLGRRQAGGRPGEKRAGLGVQRCGPSQWSVWQAAGNSGQASGERSGLPRKREGQAGPCRASGLGADPGLRPKMAEPSVFAVGGCGWGARPGRAQHPVLDASPHGPPRTWQSQGSRRRAGSGDTSLAWELRVRRGRRRVNTCLP